MSWALGLASYFVIWWTTLFAVLPIGVRGQHEEGSVVSGSEPGAPTRPRLGMKILLNTLVAGVVWLIVNFLYVRYYLEG